MLWLTSTVGCRWRYYVHCLRNVYVQRFRMYVSQLGKLRLENQPTKGDTVVPMAQAVNSESMVKVRCNTMAST